MYIYILDIQSTCAAHTVGGCLAENCLAIFDLSDAPIYKKKRSPDSNRSNQ